MKKIYLFLIFIIIPFLGNAQLVNPDFEEWIDFHPDDISNFNPNGWSCYHYLGSNPIASNYFINPPVVEAQNGDYALMLSVWYFYTKDIAVQNAPIDYRPTALSGFYKYENNLLQTVETGEEIIDTAQISVYLWKLNTTTSRKDTIGSGILNIHEEISDYESFTVNIDYFTAEVPDSITVVLDPSLVNRFNDINYISENSFSSYLTIDNLSLLTSTSNNEAKQQLTYQIYPNPVTDMLYIPDFSGEASIHDLSGRRILTDKLDFHQPLSLNTIPNGIYILLLNTGTSTQQIKIIKQY